MCLCPRNDAQGTGHTVCVASSNGDELRQYKRFEILKILIEIK